ncbi:hypothetical protein NPX13_g6005 [Xylaria arbuscula]|uniref:ABC transporter n=1 Tax=Xylaria arbuscula TaxID=114810 RepID=A0A9W8ND93_9PEZI|nr:hypothetical protein NPX13_g6005 [Xylaria arbuscula]
MMDSTKILLCGDKSFGPAVEDGCRGGFDFTVQFEELVLALLPAAVFLLLTPFRAFALLQRRIIARRNGLYFAKMGTIAVYVALQLALLVQWAKPDLRSSISIASTALSLTSGLSLALLSHLEHSKSIRPSFIITFYLVVTVFLDVARARTQWLLDDADNIAATLTASLAVKVVLLALEAIDKRRFLIDRNREYPRESTSGPLSRGFFLWLNSLLLSGFGKVLSLADLPSISEKLDSQVLAKDLTEVWDTRNQKRSHALAVATVLAFRWEVLLIVFPKLAYVALSLSQPFLIQEAVSFVQNKGAENSNDVGYGLIGAFALVYIGLAITMGWSSHLTYRLMTMMRGGLVSLIYRKMLRTPMTSLNDSAAVTLMGIDVQRIAETFHYLLVETVPAFIQLGIATYLLYLQVGGVFVVLLILSIAATLLSGQIADSVSKTQKTWLEYIQTRIHFTSEILGSMKNVKMLGLTGQMFDMIQKLRDDEIAKSKKYRRVQAYYISIVNTPDILAKILLFGAYAIAAHLNGTDSLSVSQAISSLALISLVSVPLGSILTAIPQGWGALGCFQRIQAFLNDMPDEEQQSLDANRDVSSELSSVSTELHHLPQTGLGNVTLENASFGWSQSTQNLVSGATVRIDPSKIGLTILTGPVGCGKSTFLKGILKETPYHKGCIKNLRSRVAFCDQTPWLISGSIRANIIAESEFDERWYRSVVNACALDIDISRLSHGDMTLVGSKGVKLSGGQKQRISVARAVYSRKPIAILDDILSGLDAVTEENVFRGVFGKNGLFRKIGTTVILATHSIKRLPEADLILAMDESGRIVEQGKFSDLNIPGRYVHSLNISSTPSSAEDDEGSSPAHDESASPTDAPVESQDQDSSRRQGTGRLTSTIPLHWDAGNCSCFLPSLSSMNQPMAYKVSPSCLPYYSLYLTKIPVAVWLNLWAQSNEQGGPPRLGYWLGIFAAFSVAEIIGLVSSIAYLYVDIIPNGGKHLHSSILKAALNAPMSFLARTETGVLVNRFSQDLRLADMTLPGAIVNVAFQSGQCIVATVLAATAVGYFAAVLPFVIFVLYLIQRFYLRTSRQLRLLELETSAPLFSHFIESLNGIVTIRAFGWTGAYTAKTNKLLDQSQKPFYLLLCIQRWLVLVLDLVVAGLAVLLVGLAVALRSKVNPGFLGIALVQLTSLSHALTSLVQFWTLLETSIGAIARIKDFSENTPRELTAEESSQPPPNWPLHGALSFDSISASYEDNGPLILKDVSFSVKGGQKVGIVGRTGSGKSSTVQAILRMINIKGGRILIDNVDIATLTGSVVREHIITLTQDPFLFPASIRSNIDPLGAYSDEEILVALEKVKLWSILRNKAEGSNPDTQQVLDTCIDADFLSHGQHQLFCLARALLKPGKVLILDEPTSSVDSKTDAQMQAIIRDEFREHTIIMIAHRLSSLRDFDHILVLDQGSLVETGHPDELLGNSSSRFAKMYYGSTGKQATGNTLFLLRDVLAFFDPGMDTNSNAIYTEMSTSSLDIMEMFKGRSPHRPLDKEGKEIRIVRLLPNVFSAPVECELEHIVLEPGADYEAVSYCWGDASITQPILLDGEPYSITLTLLGGLRYLRQEISPRKLWIDSLCINQTDTAERSREILRMREIYRLARSVLIWLGDFAPFTRLHVKRIFEHVARLASCSDEEQDAALIRATGYDELWRMQSELREFIQTRRWFRRIWVLQEVAVRPKPYVKDLPAGPNLLCGDLVLPFAYLRAVDEYWVTNTEDKRIGLPPICSSLDRMRVIWYGHQTILLDEEPSTLAQRLAWILALVSARFQATVRILPSLLDWSDKTYVDQRDIIYGTLGLLNADSLPAELMPDYNKSPNEVLVDFASYIVTHSQILTVLQYNSMKTQKLPTWVPDWQYDSWCPIPFGAAPHKGCHCRILVETGALEVDVVVITEISRVGPRLRCRQAGETLDSVWSDFFLDAEDSLGGMESTIWGYSSFGKALWQLLLVFDLSRQDLHEAGWHLAVAEEVPPLFFWEGALTHGLRSHSLREALSELETSIPHRYVFRGMDESIGIMCQPDVLLKEHDIVCTITGSYADFILRGCSDGYKIIGRCERSRRGNLTIGDIGLHRWAGTTHLYEFYEELWDTSDNQRMLIY